MCVFDPHVNLFCPAGFRKRWMKLYVALTPVRSTFCLRCLILPLPLYNQLTLRQQIIACGSPRKKLNITSLHISIVLQYSKQKLH